MPSGIDLAGKVGGIIQTTDPAEAEKRNREMSASPPEMKTIQPPLGPGLHGNRAFPAGTLPAQPFLSHGKRMDDLVGYAFSLLISPKFLGRLGDDRPSSLRDFAILVLEGLGQDYLSDLNVEAILIRPDRYILGAANTEAELDDLLEDFTSPCQDRRIILVAASIASWFTGAGPHTGSCGYRDRRKGI